MLCVCAVGCYCARSVGGRGLCGCHSHGLLRPWLQVSGWWHIDTGPGWLPPPALAPCREEGRLQYRGLHCKCIMLVSVWSGCAALKVFITLLKAITVFTTYISTMMQTWPERKYTYILSYSELRTPEMWAPLYSGHCGKSHHSTLYK